MARPVWRDGGQRLEDDQDHENALPSCIEEPTPEDPLVKIDVFHADSVQARPAQENLPRVLFVPRREPNDWHRSENDIVRRIELEIIDLGAGEMRIPSVEPDWYDQ